MIKNIMLIRKILKSDIKNCAELYKEIFNQSLWEESWTYEEANNRLNYIFESKGFVGFIATYENLIWGFVLGNIEPYTKGNAFYLREMCVKTQKQNKGIGKELISHLHHELKNLKIVRSYLITQQNSPASDFYLRNGYFYQKEDGVYESFSFN
ncbi:GNAT family N-acetyltransferase [Aliarcobacter cryaerophilus]|uniref:GNAT family N-acetyltransferase n=1 Tax=Aliarcobacter cryaerophilus TaxID=28198 RepID=A0A7G9LPN4_9BACT|nr:MULTISPECIES: GNAT family N-acetyltransferase [Aliarcobacter]QNM90583.1 GNAT family N-acetyltransferase [Aliarcobacter cryaerophilus]